MALLAAAVVTALAARLPIGPSKQAGRANTGTAGREEGSRSTTSLGTGAADTGAKAVSGETSRVTPVAGTVGEGVTPPKAAKLRRLKGFLV